MNGRRRLTARETGHLGAARPAPYNSVLVASRVRVFPRGKP